MNWNEVRQAYPAQWLLIEALEARTLSDHQRELERIAVIEKCADGMDAMNKYRQLHRQHPRREFYFVHTARESLDIEERRWLGIRAGHETDNHGLWV
ncbi:MAG: hypothetical protein GY862_12180 [Gammaproteobacteria bacterium]|nr:hypothetical protein [Gammaproteobacteria bacterium]